MAPQHPAQGESPRDPLVFLDIYFRTPAVLVTMVGGVTKVFSLSKIARDTSAPVLPCCSGRKSIVSSK